VSNSNQVYSCPNSACVPFLFQGGVLLEVTVAGKAYSINPYNQPLKYYSDAGGELTDLSATVVCPHCAGPCRLTDASLVFDVKPEQVIEKIDALDNRINDLMKMFKGK
jgi:hypothetical protein